MEYTKVRTVKVGPQTCSKIVFFSNVAGKSTLLDELINAEGGRGIVQIEAAANVHHKLCPAHAGVCYHSAYTVHRQMTV